MARNLAEEARTQVSNGFQHQRDPYGKKWLPLKYRKGMALQDTGRMAASVSTSTSEHGFRLDIPVKYAAPHQYGAKIAARSNIRAQMLRGNYNKRGQFRFAKKGKAALLVRAKRATFGEVGIPQRQMIPMNSTGGLGPIWTPAFHRVAGKLLDAQARGAA